MQLGIVAGYSPASMSVPMDRILEAERLGFDSVWTAEAWGSDAVSPAAWILARTSKIKVGTAIMQMPARTPAAAAMTAMTLQALSGNRFILGIGPSGSQVVEGWYGVPFGRPRTARAERGQFADCRRGTNIAPRRVMGTRSAKKVRWYQSGINVQMPA